MAAADLVTFQEVGSTEGVQSLDGMGINWRKLPKLDLLKFSGQIRNWLAFWSHFAEIDGDSTIPEADMFQYLIQAMVPGTVAENIVLSYPITASNYRFAVDSLKDRYGNESTLVKVC